MKTVYNIHFCTFEQRCQVVFRDPDLWDFPKGFVVPISIVVTVLHTAWISAHSLQCLCSALNLPAGVDCSFSGEGSICCM